MGCHALASLHSLRTCPCRLPTTRNKEAMNGLSGSKRAYARHPPPTHEKFARQSAALGRAAAAARSARQDRAVCLRVLVGDPLVVVGHVLRGAIPVPAPCPRTYTHNTRTACACQNLILSPHLRDSMSTSIASQLSLALLSAAPSTQLCAHEKRENEDLDVLMEWVAGGWRSPVVALGGAVLVELARTHASGAVPATRRKRVSRTFTA